MKKIQEGDKGFLIIELIVAVTLFLVVMVISMGSILQVFDSNRKAKAMKDVASNLSFTIESMSKELRFGTNFHCGLGGANPRDCPAGEEAITFLAQDGLNQITYKKDGDQIKKKVGFGDFIEVTASSVVVDSLTFYVFNALPEDYKQPKILITLKAHAGAVKDRTDLILETSVSQRRLDAPSS